MTAETMGTRGGRGSSPEENAWIGDRDNLPKIGRASCRERV